MALTFTAAGAQTQLDAFNDALAARAWNDARDALNAYAIIRNSLEESASHDGASYSLPDPAKLEPLIASTRAEVARNADRGRRAARCRVSHG